MAPTNVARIMIKTNVEQLIGNAVPVLLAEYVARMIINQERSNINNPT